jgi:hypothetical protein
VHELKKITTPMAAFAARFRLIQRKGRELVTTVSFLRIQPSQRRPRMRHDHFATVVAIATLLLALVTAPEAKAADRGCSNASLHGTFADKDTGFVILDPSAAPIPFAAVNLVTFDGNGQMTASGFGSFGGNGGVQTEAGTYQVNRDCTGTYTVVINPGTPDAMPAHAFFVIDDSLEELQIVVTDPGTVITCVARRQFPVGDPRD